MAPAWGRITTVLAPPAPVYTPAMNAPRVDVVSLGTLARNLLWNEARAVRTPHATTTLIRTRGATKSGTGGKTILVDPGLPAVALGARLAERTGLTPDRVTTVFLTTFRPPHRLGIDLFPRAEVVMAEREIEHARAELDRLRRQAREESVDAAPLDDALRLLDRAAVADDRLAPEVDLFPLPGYTPGTAGLLVGAATTTTLIAGPAVPTREHFLAGQLLPDVADQESAAESMREVYEVADLVVPGFDNLFLSPRGYAT